MHTEYFSAVVILVCRSCLVQNSVLCSTFFNGFTFNEKFHSLKIKWGVKIKSIVLLDWWLVPFTWLNIQLFTSLSQMFIVSFRFSPSIVKHPNEKHNFLANFPVFSFILSFLRVQTICHYLYARCSKWAQ